MIPPAKRYQRLKADQTHPAFAAFAGGYDFTLDPFQVDACRALEDGHGVLVAAPTGSGKTVVGEFAVHLALQRGNKCFYTTPIKALSNQKYADLVRRHGPDNVGLLTGDNTVNGDAPVVVMTTEVLRNMLYAGSGTLTGLGYVVMDEVHYLADRFRGAVWEEVIIHLPESVALVSLSATVSNAEEFGEWLSEVRGNTVTVVEERRPVPLFQHVLVGRRMYDLFAQEQHPGAVSAATTRVNPELERIARDDLAATRIGRGARQGGRRPGRGQSYAAHRQRGRAYTPSRVDVVERLDGAGLLPAIVFIFSRAGCAAAVEQCLRTNLRLTTADEDHEIRDFVDDHCAAIPDEDLRILGYHEFAEALSRGVAAHHAGLLPTFKECVEELFSRGLLKVVFATETLALGINMPARSVVIERLSKWNGETHADITPGEYTQLTGRAGRRGIDIEGHGVVLWQPGLDPKQVAGLASTRTYPLRSSFRPSYNMAVNLVRQFGRERARELLETSFAQFQADRAVVGLAAQLRRTEEALDGYADAMTCHLGDFMEYARLRSALSEREAYLARSRRHDRRDSVVESLDALRPGDVILVPAGRFAGIAVVIDPGTRSDRDSPRPLVLTLERHAKRLSMSDFPTPVEAFTTLRVPRTFNARSATARRDLASALRSRTQGFDPPPTSPGRPSGRRDHAPGADDEQVTRLRAQIRAHPCHACADREDHARWAERHQKLELDAVNLRRRIEQRTNSIAREFDRICEVLDALHYLDGDTVTADGQRLQRLYTELDLVAAECLRLDTWQGLTPPELAACISGLVYESRNPEDAGAPQLPRGPVGGVVAAMTAIWSGLEAVERDHRVSFLRTPDFGFAWAAYRWAAGASLDSVLTDADIAAGDFVRWVKQLLDVVDQIADAAGDTDLRAVARATGESLRRGVVAYSSVSA
ncbi:MAG: DEAD/DEAH box helicase [Nocardioidaceae bacterium]